MNISATAMATVFVQGSDLGDLKGVTGFTLFDNGTATQQKPVADIVDGAIVFEIPNVPVGEQHVYVIREFGDSAPLTLTVTVQ